MSAGLDSVKFESGYHGGGVFGSPERFFGSDRSISMLLDPPALMAVIVNLVVVE
jgi:hypothetical protein